MAKKNKNNNDNNNINEDNAIEERVTAREGLHEVAKMFTNDPDQMVVSDDEVLANMKKDLEKKISKCQEPAEKAELEKELLILQILILQREKIDKEAAIILSDSEPFGVDNTKAKEKKRRERDKKQKALIDKLNELGISNLDIEIKPPKKDNGREHGGMERKQRIR